MMAETQPYQVQDPSGAIRWIEGPVGATNEQIIAKAKELFATPGTPNTVFFDAKGNAITDPSKAIPVPPTLGEVGADVAKAVPRGLYKGVTGIAGMPGDVAEMTGIPKGRVPTTQEIRKFAEPVTGEIGEAKTEPGKITESVFEAAPSAIGPGGPLKIAGRAAAMGIGGQLGEDIAGAPGRLVGSALGPLSPRATRWALNPLPTPEWLKPHLNVLHAHGIIPTAAQASGNKNLGYVESHLGDTFFAGGQATKAYEKVEEDFTAALLRKVRALDRNGQPAKRANKEVVSDLFDRIGHEFDRLERISPASLSGSHMRNIGDAVSFYESISPSPIRGVRDAADLIKKGPAGFGGATIMDAEKYKNIRSAISRMRRATPDSQAKYAFDLIQSEMDDAVEAMLWLTHPKELGAWKQARRDYRNALIISDATAKTNRGNGIISPQAARTEVTKRDGSQSYLEGQGDFAELVRAGAEVLKPLPQSGTAPRAAAAALAMLPGTLVGAGVTPWAYAGAAAGPAMAGRAVMSPTFQNWMKMQHPTASNILKQYETRPVESILRAIPATEGEAQPRAEGGPVEPGQPYVVGERGPEVVVPSQPGQVLSDVQSMPVIPGAQYAMEWNKPPFLQMRGESPFGGTPEGAGRPGGGAANQNVPVSNLTERMIQKNERLNRPTDFEAIRKSQSFIPPEYAGKAPSKKEVESAIQRLLRGLNAP